MEDLKLKSGEEVTINIPFTYSIGDEGPITGMILETIEDCKNEVLAELENEALNCSDLFLETKK